MLLQQSINSSDEDTSDEESDFEDAEDASELKDRDAMTGLMTGQDDWM